MFDIYMLTQLISIIEIPFFVIWTFFVEPFPCLDNFSLSGQDQGSAVFSRRTSEGSGTSVLLSQSSTAQIITTMENLINICKMCSGVRAAANRL